MGMYVWVCSAHRVNELHGFCKFRDCLQCGQYSAGFHCQELAWGNVSRNGLRTGLLWTAQLSTLPQTPCGGHGVIRQTV